MARTKAEIDLLREGYVRAIEVGCLMPKPCTYCYGTAAKVYPYPKVTRARVVRTMANHTFSLRGKAVQSNEYGSMRPSSLLVYEDLEALASLLDADTLRRIADSGKCGPTEEVEDDS